MASPNHTLQSPDISDVMEPLNMMKKQNKEILEKNEEIRTKLNFIEDDNRKLRQELLEIKSYQKLQNHNGNSLSSRKRDEAEDPNEQSNNKRVRISVANLPELPACFNTLDDDCLGNVLDFVGKKCFSAFGRVNKRCHEMFCSKGYPKVTYLFGYGPLRLIQQSYYVSDISRGVLHFDRIDILDWILVDESRDSYHNLKHLCSDAIKESRVDILREVFQRANTQQLAYLRDCNNDYDLCSTAAEGGKLECLNLFRENECEWDGLTWILARDEGHDHILQYLRNNDYPTE